MNIWSVSGSKANVNGFLKPSAQMARFRPLAVEKNGLSTGIEPSALIRRILPRRLASVCELLETALSPTATYSLPSWPNAIAPPLWLDAERLSS
jgi:hypothetical protein